MSRREKILLCVILGVAVLLRVAAALYLGNVVDAPPLMTDQRSYHALGVRLLSGHGFSFDKGWYPFTQADAPTAHWSFLYSLVVAAVYAVFGVQPLAVRLVQAVLGGILLPLAVYGLGRRMFGAGMSEGGASRERDSRVAAFAPLAAAAVAAIYGYFVLYAAVMMTETFFITVVVWSLDAALGTVAYLRRRQRPPIALVVQLGLSLSIGTLLRQSILPWVPVLLVYLLWLGWRNERLRDAVRLAVLVGAMLVVSVLPWTYRNYRVYGQFLLLNSNTGYAMYSAQHPMHGTHFREFDAAPLPTDLAWGNEAVMDRQLMQRGIRFVLDDPWRYVLLSLSRVRAFFEFWPTPDTTLLHNIGRTGSFGLFLPFMLYGLYRMIRRPAPARDNTLLFLFTAFYTVLHLATWAMVRYRLPVDAAMIPCAGWAVVDLGLRVRDGLRCGRTVTGARKRRVLASIPNRVDAE